jgi:hypothetical protein
MSLRRAVVLTAVGCALVGVARAAVLRSLEINYEAGRYVFESDTYLEAPAAAIFDVLIDYDDNRFGRISSVYKESSFLEPALDGTPLVYTRLEGCVMFFCRSMERVERLETEAPRFISTTVLPEQSDFKYSRSEWRLEPEATGTRLTYHLVMEPAFWVPPVIGPWLLKRSLVEGGARAIRRIERLARELEGLEPLSPAA